MISSAYGSFGRYALQQLDVAEDDREDVVEVVRDAAGQLADRFHLLRAEQRLARLLERSRAPARSSVMSCEMPNTPRMLAVVVAVDALRDQVGLRLPILRRWPRPRTTWRAAGRKHLAVGVDECARVVLRIELEVVLADDLLRRLADEARQRRR